MLSTSGKRLVFADFLKPIPLVVSNKLTERRLVNFCEAGPSAYPLPEQLSNWAICFAQRAKEGVAMLTTDPTAFDSPHRPYAVATEKGGLGSWASPPKDHRMVVILLYTAT